VAPSTLSGDGDGRGLARPAYLPSPATGGKTFLSRSEPSCDRIISVKCQLQSEP
jgi:hypothetical protein